MVEPLSLSLASPTLEDRVVREPPEILELGRDTVDEGDAGERSLAARLENHARGTLAVDDVVDAVFDRAVKLRDVTCHHAEASVSFKEVTAAQGKIARARLNLRRYLTGL